MKKIKPIQDAPFLIQILMTIFKPLLWFVRPKIVPESPVNQLGIDPSRPVVYILPTKSIIDRLLLIKYCRKLNLQAPTAEMDQLLRGAKCSYVYLAKLGWLQPMRSKSAPLPLLEVVKKGRNDSQFHLQLVPVTIIWGRAAAKKQTSWFKLIFSDDEHAGALQKLFIVLAQGRDALVNFGQPIELQDQLKTEDSSEQIARKLRRVLRVHFRQQRLVAVGPTSYDASELISDILHSKAVQAEIAREAGDDAAAKIRVYGKAQRMLREMAALQSHTVVRFLSLMLNYLWSKIFHGVQSNHVHRIRQLAETHEIVLAASHRSHIDYLLLGFVLFQAGMPPPHTAAGANLNFWPVGWFLRRGGAFFLRRKFSGNRLYTVIFNEYLHYLVRRGHLLSFYPEGGRSRTGRLLPAKTGMLSMIVHSYIRSSERPLAIVPVYIGYDNVVEIKSYQKELQGGKKKAESISQLLSARRIFKRKYGQAYVNFGEAIELGDYLTARAPDWRGQSFTYDSKPIWMNDLVSDLGEEIMCRINASAVLSPVAMAAIALLASPKRALSEGDLMEFLDLSSKMIESMRFVEKDCMPRLGPDALVKYAESVSLIQRFRYPGSDVLHLSESDGVLMGYYKNNLSHIFTLPSLIANFFHHNERIDRESLVKGCAIFYEFLQRDFHLSWDAGELGVILQKCIDEFVSLELLDVDLQSGEICRPTVSSKRFTALRIFSGILQNVLERYGISLLLLSTYKDSMVKRDDFEQRCHLLAQRISILSGVTDPDLYDQNLYRQFVDLLRRSSFLSLGHGEFEGYLKINSKLEQVMPSVCQVMSLEVREAIQKVTWDSIDA